MNSNEFVCLNKISKYLQGLKSAILAILQTDLGWTCTVSVALKNPSQDFKNSFALGADEFLAIKFPKVWNTV